MSDIDPESTVGIYAGSEAEMIEEFDAFFETREGSYSRSREIKNAMRLYLSVQRTMEDLDLEVPERSLGHWVQNALVEQDRRERRGD